MHKLTLATIPALILGATALSACDPAAETANDKPTVIKAGAAFTHDNFKIAKGWTLGKEQYTGDAVIKGIKVTNAGGNHRTALLTFRLYKGKQVLAEIECDSKEMQKGEVSTLDCMSTDKLPKSYDSIKIADMF